jgi:hypothetical protein
MFRNIIVTFTMLLLIPFSVSAQTLLTVGGSSYLGNISANSTTSLQSITCDNWDISAIWLRLAGGGQDEQLEIDLNGTHSSGTVDITSSNQLWEFEFSPSVTCDGLSTITIYNPSTATVYSYGGTSDPYADGEYLPNTAFDIALEVYGATTSGTTTPPVDNGTSTASTTVSVEDLNRDITIFVLMAIYLGVFWSAVGVVILFVRRK